MASYKQILAGLACLATAAAAAEVDDMGPAAFMWPEDRVWAAAVDNNAPCGSRASPGNRTDFPMQKGQIALVAQDESWDIELSISYLEDPKSNSDFNTLIDAKSFREIDPGHTCVPVSDAPDSVTAGDKATLQIKYIADFDKPVNETFYACADIRFVETASFKVAVPCFNATEPEDSDGAGKDWDFHDFDGDDDKGNKTEESPNGSDADNSNDNNNSDNNSDSSKSEGGGGGSGLSGGAIAGIVVGVVAAVAIAALALLIYRRRQRKLMELRQKHSSRGVEWNEPQAKGSVSSSSVRMQNLSR